MDIANFFQPLALCNYAEEDRRTLQRIMLALSFGGQPHIPPHLQQTVEHLCQVWTPETRRKLRH